jgi:hypothetical protein
MGTLIDIIKEEKERLEKLLIFYKQEISKQPKGYISKKKINGNEYCYRAYREGNTVKTVFVGVEGSDEVKKVKEKINERKKLEFLNRKAKENLIEVKKALREKR